MWCKGPAVCVRARSYVTVCQRDSAVLCSRAAHLHLFISQHMHTHRAHIRFMGFNGPELPVQSPPQWRTSSCWTVALICCIKHTTQHNTVDAVYCRSDSSHSETWRETLLMALISNQIHVHSDSFRMWPTQQTRSSFHAQPKDAALLSSRRRMQHHIYKITASHVQSLYVLMRNNRFFKINPG